MIRAARRRHAVTETETELTSAEYHAQLRELEARLPVPTPELFPFHES